MRVTLKLDVPGTTEAEQFRLLVRDWAEAHGASGVMSVDDGAQQCPHCGATMVYDGMLDTWVCSHIEDSPTVAED